MKGRTRLIFLTVIITLLALSGGMLVMAHGGDTNLIHACVNNGSGEIKIIGANDTCKNNETPLDWGIFGPVGPQGPQGDTGPQGPQGDTGPKGDQGDTGPQGPQGDAGPQGPQGDIGPAGADGAQGPAGPQGPQGDTGPAGADGAQGPAGPQGPQGDTGPAGADGAQGPAGPQGPQGDTGAVGPQGPKGDPGLSGVNYRVGSAVAISRYATRTAYATCPTGQRVIGGGHEYRGSTNVNYSRSFVVLDSMPVNGNQWRVRAMNDGYHSNLTIYFRAWAVCANVN